jgi:hypothetical protein
VPAEHLIHTLNCGFPIPGSALDANHEYYATKRTIDDNVNFHGPSGRLSGRNFDSVTLAPAAS